MCAFKPSFKSQELGLSGIFTVTFLWTAAGGTIGHFWSSSWSSWEGFALGRGRVRSWSLPDLAHTFELTRCNFLLLLKEPPCHCSPLLVTHCMNGNMHGLVYNCHFWEGRVHWSDCQVARLWGGGPRSLSGTCLTAHIVLCCSFCE